MNTEVFKRFLHKYICLIISQSKCLMKWAKNYLIFQSYKQSETNLMSSIENLKLYNLVFDRSLVNILFYNNYKIKNLSQL